VGSRLPVPPAVVLHEEGPGLGEWDAATGTELMAGLEPRARPLGPLVPERIVDERSVLGWLHNTLVGGCGVGAAEVESGAERTKSTTITKVRKQSPKIRKAVRARGGFWI